MSTTAPHYVRLVDGSPFPGLKDFRPFKAVLACETSVSQDWRNAVSAWLVNEGCLYMMAWGEDCSLWDDTVDVANMERFGLNEIPDDDFVMTTWHDSESLKEVFWFAEYCAIHPSVELNNTVLVHIGLIDKGAEFAREFAAIESA